MKEKLLIIGSAGHAKVVIDSIENINLYQIVGLIDDFKRIGDKVCNYPVVGKVSDLSKLIKDRKINNLFIAIGDNFGREIVYNKVLKNRIKVNIVNVIHPDTIISKKTKIGMGVYIAPGSTINRDAIISDFVIVNTNAVIEHDNILEEFCSIGPSATLAGNVKIKKGSAIGLNSSVIEKITIGRNCVVGAGSVVLDNIKDNSVVVGVPGKVIKTRKKSDKYLR